MRDITTLNNGKALDILDRIEFFEAFSPEEKEQLAGFYSRFCLFNPNETIVHEGEMCDTLYILLTGQVKVHKSDIKEPLAVLEPGDIFGEICFLTQEKRISSVSANEQSIVLEIDQGMMQVFSSNVREKIKDKIIHKLVSRLDRMNGRLYASTLK